MKSILPILILSALMLDANATSVFVDGNQLARWARADDAVVNGRGTDKDESLSDRFVGYVEGIVDALDDRIICTPPDTKFGQLRAMVRKYVLDNPEHWGGGGNDMIIAALQSTFPCHH